MDESTKELEHAQEAHERQFQAARENDRYGEAKAAREYAEHMGKVMLLDVDIRNLLRNGT